jgi:predicted DNA-binding transcriptional regulator AlpA
MTATIQKLAVRPKEAAAMCGMSRPTWDRNVAAGKTPKPRKVGGIVTFSVKELERWLELGCPDRATFEKLK